MRKKLIFSVIGIGILYAATFFSGQAVEGKAVLKGMVKYYAVIAEAAQINDIHPALIAAVIHAESNFNPRAVSIRGAKGLMQINPPTQRYLRLKNAYDPHQNVHAGSRYLKELLTLFRGNLSLALAAYNAGPGAVAKHDGIPPFKQTRAYVKKVLAYYRHYRDTFNRSALPS
jgi:soluble lytic murein transglycosylase